MLENTENNNECLSTRIRICSVCGKDEITNKFKLKGKRCIKCYSNSNNIKHREKDYFKKYYQDSKLAKLNNEMVV